MAHADQPGDRHPITPPGSCGLCYSTRSTSLAQTLFSPASPGIFVSLTLSPMARRVAVRYVTFVPFRPGFPRAERKLREGGPWMQIDDHA